MSSELLSLSTEVLIEIIFLLPVQHIITCSRTCRRLRTVVLDTPLLQYVIYAHQAGVEYRLPPGSIIPDRLAKLQRWEAAWNSLDAASPSGGKVELRGQPDMKTTSILRDGFLIITRCKDGSTREQSAGYSAIDLRSRATDWVSSRFTDDAIAFDFSIEQNLVAMLHVYVTSLSDFATNLIAFKGRTRRMGRTSTEIVSLQ